MWSSVITMTQKNQEYNLELENEIINWETIANFFYCE